jgi:hypothetical protein
MPWELPRRKRGQQKPSSGVGKAAAAAVVVLAAAGIITVGALSIRAAATSGATTENDLVIPALVGTMLPLAILALGWLRLHRRVTAIVLAFSLGLGTNVVYLAHAVPADAAAGNTSDFFLTLGSGYGCAGSPVIRDMPQTNINDGASMPGAAGRQYPWCSDTFASTQSLGAGTTVASIQGWNTSASKDCTVSGELLWWHFASDTLTSLGTPGTTIFPRNTSTVTLFTWSWPTSAVAAFATGDRLRFIFTFVSGGSNCNNAGIQATMLANPSKITTATIVPEGVAGLLLLAPMLPFAARWWKRRRP